MGGRAQETGSPEATSYRAEIAGSVASGDHTPFWMVSNRYGIVPLEANNGYLKAGVFHDQTFGDGFRWGAGLDVVAAVPRYREGVVAQFFYVGAQIMCWTFIIQYGTRLFMDMGMAEQAAEVRSQQFNIAAMALFCVSRFICTFLLRFFNPGWLLRTLAVVACLFTLGVVFFQDIWGMYCIVGVSACMSLMFPTIYGIALQGLGEDAKFGAAGLIMAILGGSVLPPLQASVIDLHEVWGMPAVNISFLLPFLCFVVVVVYGHRSYRQGWA